MADPTTLDKVKLALRIVHTKLDTELAASILTAKAELARAGLVSAAISETDNLILEAIKTYCKYSYASDEKMREGYFMSWQYQLDCLRKTLAYNSYKVTFTVKTSGAVAIQDACITLDDSVLYTDSKGEAYIYSTSSVDIDYVVSKSGYTSVSGSVYVDGTEAVAITLS